MTPTRHERTHARLIECALELFEVHGFEQTTVAQIASSAGVTQMTFFRHFPSKAAVVTVDPYDPAIATAIAARPRALPPVLRATGGVRDAVTGLDERELSTVRRRVRIIAGSETLRAESTRSSSATETAIARALIADGTSPLTARAVAAAVMASLTAALLAWAEDDELTLLDAIGTALAALEARDD